MQKILLFILAVCLLTAPAFGTVGGWPINRPPTESWLSGSVGDPLWNWVKAVDRLVEIGSELGTGTIFYVDSGVTTASNGSSWDNAFATFAPAILACATNTGDYIMIAEGHNEGSGSAYLFSLYRHGVTVVGKGKGALKPTFDCEGLVTMARISGDNCTVRNIRFRAAATSLASNAPAILLSVDAGADYASILGCDFGYAETEGDYFGIGITIGVATGTLVQGCNFDSQEQLTVAMITPEGSTMTRIIGNTMYGDCSVADIYSATTANIRIMMAENILWNGVHSGLNAQPVIQLGSNDTGISIGNKAFCNVATVAAAFVGAKIGNFANYYNEDVGGGTTAVALDSATTTVNNASITRSGDD